MKRLFIDTNIIVDLIADRKPFSKFAIEIFNRAEIGLVKLYTSSHTIATTHYLLKKYVKEEDLREILYDLLNYISIISIDIDILKRGLKSTHKDFEDALQILSAYTIENMDCIVTRNTKDFKEALIPVYTSDEIVRKIS